MTRPDIACVCLTTGIHAALTVTGEHRAQLIQAFKAEHTGPSHVPEVPPRSWYGREAEFRRHLARMRTALGNTDDVQHVHATTDVQTGGKL